MAEVKTFKVKRKQRQPIEFHLEFEREVPNEDGEGTHIEEITEKFHARPSIPGFQLLDIAASMTGDGGVQSAAIRDFLSDVVVDEDTERWLQVLRDPANDVDADTLAEISDYLMEQYGERPTDTP